MRHATTMPSPTEPARPSTRPSRVVFGLLLGALCGAVLVSGLVLAMALVQYGALTGLTFAALAFPVALVAWLTGLVVIGGPIWWALRKSNARPTRLAARVSGVVASLATVGPTMAITFAHGHGGYLALLTQVAMFAAVGAAVGWVVARVAYGRPGGVR